jgi:hypothetical protein
MALNIVPTPTVITLIPQSRSNQNPLSDCRDSLWAEFGQLQISDSTRKQYVKATAEDGAQASRISVSSLTIALRLQRLSPNF